MTLEPNARRRLHLVCATTRDPELMMELRQVLEEESMSFLPSADLLRSIALCAAWLLHIAAAAGGPVLAPLGVALAVFAVGAALFACGWLGGGDVKLLAAAALWAGPAGLPQLLILTGVIGGALALFLLNPAGRQLAFAARMMIGGGVPPAGTGIETPVPYGVAIAGAALFAILRPYFG